MADTVESMAKRGDKRRARERAKRRLRRLPYEGFKAGPLRVERYGRSIRMSLDPTLEGFEEFRQAQIDAAASLPGHYAELRDELRTSLAHFDAFDVLANLWLLNVPKDPETYACAGLPGRSVLGTSREQERPVTAASGRLACLRKPGGPAGTWPSALPPRLACSRPAAAGALRRSDRTAGGPSRARAGGSSGIAHRRGPVGAGTG